MRTGLHTGCQTIKIALLHAAQLRGAAVAQSCMRLHPAEAAQGLPACLFWRSVPVTESSIVRLPPMLPPGAMDGDVAALAQARTDAARLSDALLKPAWPARVLGCCEAFVSDAGKERDRWCGAARAGVPDVERAVHHLVRVVL